MMSEERINNDVRLFYCKMFKLTLSFILEDGVQLCLQYFFFEKYLTEIDPFIFANGMIKLGIMIVFLFQLGERFYKLLYEI